MLDFLEGLPEITRRVSRPLSMLTKFAFRSRRLGIVAISLGAVGLMWASWSRAVPLFSRFFRKPVDFSRDIKPILNQNCILCHGGVRQKNGVSFIFREAALGIGKSGRPTIVPGNPDGSEFMARVTSTDPDARMPYHAPPLPPDQIELLRRWIKEGAKWTDHWAFVPPKSQPLPTVKHPDWVRQPLDRFILARLDRESLKPTLEASKSELLRRVSLDLTGLPPTEEEEATYLADSSPKAYEKQVDRLLASPGYGERWASMWLDLARYADTMGYEADRRRPGVWPYRDWVIDAFNRNLPYDQFVTTQLAGDLFPNPTFADRIATSFHRQTPNNQEGGTDDEEFRMIAVIDRVATTWSVLNGVTMNCVQCHSHPYDPIRHADYYKSLAFFNTSNDADLDDDSPFLRVPKDRARDGEASQIQQEIAQLLRSQEASDRAVEEKSGWELLPIQSAGANEVLALERIVPELELELSKLKEKKMPPKAKAEQMKDLLDTLSVTKKRLAHAKAVGGPAKTFHIHDGEAFADANTPPQSFYELITAATAKVVTAIRVEVPPLEEVKARHTPEPGFIVNKVQASILRPNGLKEEIAFRYFIQDSEANLEDSVSEAPAPKQASGGKEVASGFAANPKLFRTRWIVGVPSKPLQLAPGSRIVVALKQTKSIDSKPALIQRVRLLAPDVPAIFPKLPADEPRNRLTLARWFFAPGQPLTARVAVNRYWEELFGTGLVETLENFGSVGEGPSHPELLDWLALHFQNDLHWDIKALLRELVTSATYRQSAASTPVLTERDPRNRLLARGPLQRLTAEMLRDQALVASGLLNRTVGGPPVMPPQPAGVWKSVYNDDGWKDATGPNRYRRAIYTFVKRTSGYPSFLTFDASDRDTSLPRRIPTNTPLQALVTLNDPVYQEAAESLARRAIRGAVRKTNGGSSAEDVLDARLSYESRLVLSRDPTPRELSVLRDFFKKTLTLSDQSSPVLAKMKVRDNSVQEVGAFTKEMDGLTAVGSVLFNLDAALRR